MISRAVELPEVRSSILEWLVRAGPSMFTAAIKAGKQPVRPDMEDEKAGLYLAKAEARRLDAAELFWVDEAMTDLVLGAASSMPPFNLLPEDLPSPAGLIVFEKPLLKMRAHDQVGDYVYVRAASWGPFSGGPWHLWVSWYTDTALNWEHIDAQRLAEDLNIPISKAREVTRQRLKLPPLSYENEAQLSFSREPLPYVSPSTGEEVPGSDYPLKELVTAWALMQQPIARVSEAEFDRATRRRLQREKIEPKPVRVITLRRPKSTSDHGDGDREYRHQWIVRGHWRQQWYPARKVHRPVWIAPHVKGPEGAPLLGGDKVYTWTR